MKESVTYLRSDDHDVENSDESDEVRPLLRGGEQHSSELLPVHGTPHRFVHAHYCFSAVCSPSLLLPLPYPNSTYDANEQQSRRVQAGRKEAKRKRCEKPGCAQDVSAGLPSRN